MKTGMSIKHCHCRGVSRDELKKPCAKEDGRGLIWEEQKRRNPLQLESMLRHCDHAIRVGKKIRTQ
jgi:hypothetical protein